jgi:hypothetical protein
MTSYFKPITINFDLKGEAALVRLEALSVQKRCLFFLDESQSWVILLARQPKSSRAMRRGLIVPLGGFAVGNQSRRAIATKVIPTPLN